MATRTTPFTTITLKRGGTTLQTGIAVQIDNMSYAEAADLGGSSPHDSYWIYAEGQYDIRRSDLLQDEKYTDPRTNQLAIYRVFGQTEPYGFDHVELPCEKVAGL